MTEDHDRRPAVGIALPTNRIALTGGDLRTAVAELESAGCHSVWVNDHLALFPVGADVYPYTANGKVDWDPAAPQYEALSVCAFVAAATERMRIGTAVLVLPQRHPVEVAKMAATLADLTGGRFVLGVGAGWSRREMALLGWDPANRGARMDEQLDVIRACWRPGGGLPEPRHYRIPGDVILEPKPRADQVPLILVGGNSPAAVARAGLRGDGWLPVTTPERDRLDRLSRTLAALRRSAGRRLRGVIKVVLEIPDPRLASEVVDGAFADGWDEVTFEFKKWDLSDTCRMVGAAVSACAAARP